MKNLITTAKGLLIFLAIIFFTDHFGLLPDYRVYLSARGSRAPGADKSNPVILKMV
jgi:hypothetical protein